MRSWSEGRKKGPRRSATLGVVVKLSAPTAAPISCAWSRVSSPTAIEGFIDHFTHAQHNIGDVFSTI
eukprot:3066813-Amphidinium_carterae.2